MAELIYYRRNVPYVVIVRRNIMDNQGISLNPQNEWVAVNPEDLRDFKLANKYTITQGLIIPTDTPSVDWETSNALTEDDMNDLLKNYMKLKNTIKTVDSVPILWRLLELAREQDKSDKIKNLIKERLEEISGDEILSPAEMQGIS